MPLPPRYPNPACARALRALAVPPGRWAGRRCIAHNGTLKNACVLHENRKSATICTTPAAVLQPPPQERQFSSLSVLPSPHGHATIVAVREEDQDVGSPQGRWSERSTGGAGGCPRSSHGRPYSTCAQAAGSVAGGSRPYSRRTGLNQEVLMSIRITGRHKCLSPPQVLELTGFIVSLGGQPKASYTDRNGLRRILCGSIELLFGRGMQKRRKVNP